MRSSSHRDKVPSITTTVPRYHSKTGVGVRVWPKSMLVHPMDIENLHWSGSVGDGIRLALLGLVRTNSASGVVASFGRIWIFFNGFVFTPGMLRRACLSDDTSMRRQPAMAGFEYRRHRADRTHTPDPRRVASFGLAFERYKQKVTNSASGVVVSFGRIWIFFQWIRICYIILCAFFNISLKI